MNDTLRKYWNMDIEPRLNSSQMKEFQFKKLQESLKWQYENAPYNRKRFDAAGVKPEDIKNFDDFAAAIPAAGQEEIRSVIAEIGFDMNKLMTHIFGEKRMKDLYLLTTTSGTTGIPTPYPNFKASLGDAQEIMSRAAWRTDSGVRMAEFV